MSSDVQGIGPETHRRKIVATCCLCGTRKNLNGPTIGKREGDRVRLLRVCKRCREFDGDVVAAQRFLKRQRSWASRSGSVKLDKRQTVVANSVAT